MIPNVVRKAKRFVNGLLAPEVTHALPNIAGEALFDTDFGFDCKGGERPLLGAEFDLLVEQIEQGAKPDAHLLLPYLCAEILENRIEANYRLALACFRSDNLTDAKTFIDRTWRLCGGRPIFLPVLLQIYSATGHVEGIRSAYKTLGIKAAEVGNLEGAIAYFDLWHYAAMTYLKEDRYEIDSDILTAIDRLAAPHRAAPSPKRNKSGKIRVGYLLRGVIELNSVLLKISHVLIGLHDKEQFEIVAIVPETAEQIERSPQGKDHLERLKASGCEVLCNGFAGLPSGHVSQSLLGLAEQIRGADLDILVTSACLVDFSTCFLTALKPAPKIVGLIQGPPGQFAHPALDWSIAWSRHPLMDSPCNSTLVELKMTGKSAEIVKPASKAELHLPDNARVLMSSGRLAKFQDRQQWQAIGEMLQEHSDLYYVVVGTLAAQIDRFDSMVPAAVRERVKFLGWRTDFSRLVTLADVLLDTYPSGGGQVIVEAMAQGVLVVAHRNDFLKEFSQTDWSPVEDFVTDSNLLVKRGDFEALKKTIHELLNDDAAWQRASSSCKQSMAGANPLEGLRQCEEVYKMVAGR